MFGDILHVLCRSKRPWTDSILVAVREKVAVLDKPIVWHQNGLGRVDKAWLGMAWGIEDFARVFVGRGHDDEAEGKNFRGKERVCPIMKTYMLNTLTTLSAPEFH